MADWDGHALTLSLLGAYLADLHGGDVAYIGEIPSPTADEPRYERVHRVLRRYDEHLTEAERAFLTLFSAFRTPVEEIAFKKVFRADMGADALNAPIAALDDADFEEMIQRLVAYRILRYGPHARHYTAHPLIRNHYYARLIKNGKSQTQTAHKRIKDYYLAISGSVGRPPSIILPPGYTLPPLTLDDLAPLIEAVHHACRAGTYDEAQRIRWERIDQHAQYVLLHQLSAYETALALMLEYFPGHDTSREPQVSDPNAKYSILNTVGYCLVSLGRLSEAAIFHERATALVLGIEDWLNASIGYRNLAELYTQLGALAASTKAAREALALARRAKDKLEERNSLTQQARSAHLCGNLETADTAFQKAEALERESYPNVRYLNRNGGIWHADHLRRVGNAAYARRITEANLEICERYHWTFIVSRCHRVLGDLDADSGKHDSAHRHYDTALKIARGITFRPVLIEALLARGRWAARLAAKDPKGLEDPSGLGLAFSDLNEALGYAVDGGYRIFEADIRVALAWAHLAAAKVPPPEGEGAAARAEALRRAQDEAKRAQRMSADMGYHWGQVDAAEVLETVRQHSEEPL